MTLDPLPIDDALPEVEASLAHHQALVIVADPGAGKTTRVPPALLAAGRAIVLQPRRSAARAIARRLADERGWTLGCEVGWQVRQEKSYTPQTRLIIATEGILTARLQGDPLLSDFATVVLDEFHERSIHADTALALMKQALRAREDLRLVVMSATLNAVQVPEYLGRCPVVRVSGRSHPLRIEYTPKLTMAQAVERALNESSGNTLCFQPGAAEITRCTSELRDRIGNRCDVLPLHGSLPADEQDQALGLPASRPRVIACTNIAETSLTVPGVTAVVDSGLEKLARYDAVKAIDRLITERASAASVDQRAGRAARTAPGVAYRIWSRADRLKEHREADIHRVDLAGVALDVIAWGGDPRTLDWFEPPTPDALDAAIDLLNRLGAVNGTTLTALGRKMSHLPIPPRLARIVLAPGGTGTPPA